MNRCEEKCNLRYALTSQEEPIRHFQQTSQLPTTRTQECYYCRWRGGSVHVYTRHSVENGTPAQDKLSGVACHWLQFTMPHTVILYHLNAAIQSSFTCRNMHKYKLSVVVCECKHRARDVFCNKLIFLFMNMQYSLAQRFLLWRTMYGGGNPEKVSANLKDSFSSLKISKTLLIKKMSNNSLLIKQQM